MPPWMPPYATMDAAICRHGCRHMPPWMPPYATVMPFCYDRRDYPFLATTLDKNYKVNPAVTLTQNKGHLARSGHSRLKNRYHRQVFIQFSRVQHQIGNYVTRYGGKIDVRIFSLNPALFSQKPVAHLIAPVHVNQRNKLEIDNSLFSNLYAI